MVGSVIKYQQYTEYKNSGVEWLEEVPQHWALVPCRAVVDHIVEKNSNNALDNYLSLMANIGVIRYEDKGDIGNKKPDDLSKCKIVRRGQLVINSMNYAIGSYGMSPYDGICSPVYIVLQTKKDIFLERFALRIFENTPFQKYLATFGNGILEHRAAINWEDIKNKYVPLPTLDEQKNILDFLDHETSKIDSLIEKQQQLIQLLKEKRQVVISHAVTKGLNSNVPMKDSGVEWLGEVPEHWTVSKLKYFASIQGGFAFSSDLFIEEGTQVLRIGNVYQNSLSLDRQPIFIASDLVKNFQDFIVKKDDVLMSLTGTLGKRDYGFAIKVETDDQYLLNQRVAKISPNKKIDTDFMVYVLWSESYLTQLYSLPSGTKQANLSNSDVLGIEIVIPPTMEEQKDIARYIKEKLAKFDEMILKAESAIQLMQERRTALISSAVTGKIDVRNWQNPNKNNKGNMEFSA